MIAAARGGERRGAIDALGAFRVLCAHRRGAYGVSVWTARIEGWLAGELERGRWYPGRPLLVTENDYGLRLYNGDTGVVVADGGRPARARPSSAAARSSCSRRRGSAPSTRSTR